MSERYSPPSEGDMRCDRLTLLREEKEDDADEESFDRHRVLEQHRQLNGTHGKVQTDKEVLM